MKFGFLNFFKKDNSDEEEQKPEASPQEELDAKPAPPPPPSEPDLAEKTAAASTPHVVEEPDEEPAYADQIASILDDNEEEDDDGEPDISSLISLDDDEEEVEAPLPETGNQPGDGIPAATADTVYVPADKILPHIPDQYLADDTDSLIDAYKGQSTFTFSFNRSDLMYGLSRGRLQVTIGELVNKTPMQLFADDHQQSSDESITLPLPAIVPLIPPDWFMREEQDNSKERIIKDMDNLFPDLGTTAAEEPAEEIAEEPQQATPASTQDTTPTEAYTDEAEPAYTDTDETEHVAAPVQRDPIKLQPKTKKPEPIAEESVPEEKSVPEPVAEEPVPQEKITLLPKSEEPEEDVVPESIAEESVPEERSVPEPVAEEPVPQEKITLPPKSEEPEEEAAEAEESVADLARPQLASTRAPDSAPPTPPKPEPIDDLPPSVLEPTEMDEPEPTPEPAKVETPSQPLPPPIRLTPKPELAEEEDDQEPGFDHEDEEEAAASFEGSDTADFVSDDFIQDPKEVAEKIFATNRQPLDEHVKTTKSTISVDTASPWKSQAPNGINVNRASKEDLEKLPGIGSYNAQLIIDYRANNRFTDLQQLMDITGLGRHTYRSMTGLSHRADLKEAEMEINYLLDLHSENIVLSDIAKATVEQYNLQGLFMTNEDGLVLASYSSNKKVEKLTDSLSAIAPILDKRNRRMLSQGKLPVADMYTFYLGKFATTFAGSEDILCACVHKSAYPGTRDLRALRKIVREIVWYCSYRAVI